jgi:hypothetical protein
MFATAGALVLMFAAAYSPLDIDLAAVAVLLLGPAPSATPACAMLSAETSAAGISFTCSCKPLVAPTGIGLSIKFLQVPWDAEVYVNLAKHSVALLHALMHALAVPAATRSTHPGASSSAAFIAVSSSMIWLVRRTHALANVEPLRKVKLSLVTAAGGGSW